MQNDKFDLAEYKVSKSRDLVHGKYRATDLEYDIMNIAMTRIQKVQTDEKEELVAKLYPNDINRIVKKGKNIYRDIKTTSSAMPGHTMVIEKSNGDGFVAFSIMPKVEYENNVLTIHFSDELKPHLLGLTGNFEIQNIAITSILKGYAKRLYEILNSHAFKIPSNGAYHTTYRVSELKFMLGIANMDEAGVKKKIASYKKGEEIDYDYLYDHVVKEKMYERWDKFSAGVLKKAQKEFEEKADIKFEYFGIREGHETKKVEFAIYRNQPSVDWQQIFFENKKIIGESSTSDYQEYTLFENMYPLVAPYINHNGLTEEDLTILLGHANNNSKLVVDAINYADQQEHISNYMGYLVNFIKKGGFKEPIEVMDGSAEGAKMAKEIHKESKSETNQKRMWERIQNNDDFEEYLDEMGVSFENMDILFDTYAAKVENYVEWKTGRKAN